MSGHALHCYCLKCTNPPPRLARVTALREAADLLALEEVNLGMMNTPTDPEARVKSAAAYRLTADKRRKAEEEYQRAFGSMVCSRDA